MAQVGLTAVQIKRLVALVEKDVSRTEKTLKDYRLIDALKAMTPAKKAKKARAKKVAKKALDV